MIVPFYISTIISIEMGKTKMSGDPFHCHFKELAGDFLNFYTSSNKMVIDKNCEVPRERERETFYSPKLLT